MMSAPSDAPAVAVSISTSAAVCSLFMVVFLA